MSKLSADQSEQVNFVLGHPCSSSVFSEVHSNIGLNSHKVPAFTHQHLDQESFVVGSATHKKLPLPDSDTDSLHTVTDTEDSFLWPPGIPSASLAPPTMARTPYHSNQAFDDYGSSPGQDPSLLGRSPDAKSQLLNSSGHQREQEDRGTLNSGYIREPGPMDYMQEDPYSSHRFSPHDPYYSGGGGGGYDPNYPNNTSFDHSQHSYQSGHNAHVPNGGGPPYGSNGHLYQPEQDQSGLMHPPASPLPREGSYAGSRGSFQGDPYADHGYPEDPYHHRPQNDYDPGSGYPQEPGQYNYEDPYHGPEGDRYSDVPRSRQSLDQPGDATHPKYDGLPPVQSDPFGQDPFREQHSHEGSQMLQPEDNYGRGPSPLGGPEPAPYDDRGPPYDDRGPPYDDRGPPYDDRGQPYDDRGPPYDDRGPVYNDGGPPISGQPYDDRLGPDLYGQHEPHYPENDPHYPENGPHYPENGPQYPESDPRYPENDSRYPENDARYPEDYPDHGSVYSGRPAFQGDTSFQPDQDPAQRMEQLNLGSIPNNYDESGVPPPAYNARNPDIQEVIDFLSSPDDTIKASAAAYLQHITYMDDAMKAKTRGMGGIRPLVYLLSHDLVEVHKNACGALQNLSYGRNNSENKKAIRNENGIPELIRLLRKTDQEDVKESVTGVLWNLSSCEDLKLPIIDDGLSVLVNVVILKYSDWNNVRSALSSPWTTVCRNTTGVLRNVSSAGFDARKRLRECKGLVNSLIYILKLAVEDVNSHDIDNKPVENTVCILRNLSYRIQEVVDPDFFKKRTLPRQQSQPGSGKGNSGPGCFGNKSNKAKNSGNKPGHQTHSPPELPPLAVEYRGLWGPEIHTLYSSVLKRCVNPITMEAAAGAIQNLTACDWQPAVESRSMVRKEKGLPLLVDLLSAESDRVVCATATALRNLAIDEKNKELVGKYAIRQLVSRLPKDNRNKMPDDTICAVVATLYEVIKDNQDFAMSLIVEDGLPRLIHINQSEGLYLARTLKFTQTLLKTLWGFKALHMEYEKHGYSQQDFQTSRSYPRTPNSSAHTTPFNTLSRPMSGQEGYDDNTLTPGRGQRLQPQVPSAPHTGGYHSPAPHNDPDIYREINRSNASLHDRDRLNYSRERIPLEEIRHNDLGPGYLPLDEPRPHHRSKPPAGAVPLFPHLSPEDPQQQGQEPLYAQVQKGNRRRPEGYQDLQGHFHDNGMPAEGGDEAGGADSWV